MLVPVIRDGSGDVVCASTTQYKKIPKHTRKHWKLHKHGERGNTIV